MASLAWRRSVVASQDLQSITLRPDRPCTDKKSAPAVAALLGPRGACRIRIGGQVEVCTKSKELSFHNELRDGGQELRLWTRM
ncbi:hypothetical protein MPTK1_1g22320 [Marchantia polymorpha subsp. ruderalis]|uniref:Uncharacterized protein n=2 Tax=Marchantia polymorpha TaxID=3197 RepID=A0AAF6AT31_MARPO|nr:hypothetical protein MARPO_0001s0570 [Marchantia polymorpha]BBM99601.1 hypothetical protein Mp_1g22320 [Marchantia polymorpha subsp. ruderalis]|eukprot:PTQ50689.1 hypothetical protein MARPO_0001s0570 [Marchantia polymorpha]